MENPAVQLQLLKFVLPASEFAGQLCARRTPMRALVRPCNARRARPAIDPSVPRDAPAVSSVPHRDCFFRTLQAGDASRGLFVRIFHACIARSAIGPNVARVARAARHGSASRGQARVRRAPMF